MQGGLAWGLGAFELDSVEICTERENPGLLVLGFTGPSNLSKRMFGHDLFRHQLPL